ncbi:MAG: penicillin-binding transpeptidase domain-containing protein, partial [Calditrichia bacterium]
MSPQEDVRTKRIVFFTLSLAIIVVLALRFFSLQIVSGEIYKKKSIENSVKIETKLPVRGNIYDRNGKLIADNRPAFSLYLVRSRTRPGTIKKLVTTLNLDEKDIRKKLKRAGYFQPVKVARHVKRVALTEFQENILDLPGLEWKIEPKRNYYYYNKCFSHILGTLGEIDDSELGKNSEYEPGDIVGKKGIEKALDVELRGKKGYQYIRVDAMGRSVEVVDPKNSALPHPGKDLYLTIDARLQMYADTLFEGKRGALVAIDTHNGELITLLSNPSYDLNIFTSTIDEKEWKKLITDENHPLYDRACQSLYPPGSTFKMVAAIAALNERIVSPDWKVTCPGYLKIGRKTVRCWKADGHGTLDMLGAIKNSCNVYFYSLGLKIGLDVWNKYRRLFLFGQKTGIELPNEKNGLVPSEAYYKNIYG